MSKDNFRQDFKKFDRVKVVQKLSQDNIRQDLEIMRKVVQKLSQDNSRQEKVVLFVSKDNIGTRFIFFRGMTQKVVRTCPKTTPANLFIIYTERKLSNLVQGQLLSTL